MLALADRLGKSIAEVERMPVAHFNEWVAYFKIVDQESGEKRHGGAHQNRRSG